MKDSPTVNEIFTLARQNEPNYSETNFINRIDVGTKRQRMFSVLRDGTITVIAIFIGIITIQAKIPLDSLISNIPTSIVINPISLLLAAGLSSALCCFTYLILED